MNLKNIDRKQLILGLCCFAGTILITSLLRIKMPFTYPLGRQQVPAGVYMTLGDICVFPSVLLLGVPWGMIVFAVGSALADLIVGSKVFIMGTLLIKAAMALFVAAFCMKCDDWRKSFVIAFMTEGIMLLGYFIFDLLILREFKVAGLALLSDLGQAAACGALGGVILRYLPVMDPNKLLNVRRAPKERED